MKKKQERLIEVCGIAGYPVQFMEKDLAYIHWTSTADCVIIIGNSQIAITRESGIALCEYLGYQNAGQKMETTLCVLK